ncbi:MAG: precorrin-2 C(20)-methyltransferase [Comamonadaceae bacterium]|nr:precorrin-2 C(20)-methyltransferase [Comamonadaceae bacterium]
MHEGTLYGVSLGPGDPDLMTRRAHALLQRADTCWVYPVRTLHAESYALAIAERAGLTPPPGHAPLVFPMTHDPEKLAKHWARAAETVRALLAAGRDVLFLVEGDASTFATFGHLARTLQAMLPDVRVETVPGVTSFAASAARIGVPLAEQDDAIAVVPATRGLAAVERLLDDVDTLVLMKVKPLLDELIELLARRGLLAGACFVERAGAPDERVVRDVASLRGQPVNYLSLLIVKLPPGDRGGRVRGCRTKRLTSTEAAAEAAAAARAELPPRADGAGPAAVPGAAAAASETAR